MLPQVYEDASIAASIIEDPSTAPIPETHKAMYVWMSKFVRGSWDMTPADIQMLRDAGIDDHEIVVWAQIGAMQTYLVMMGDGGGVSLDHGQTVGPVVGRGRSSYTDTGGVLLTSSGGGVLGSDHAVDNAWVVPGQSSAEYEQAAEWARHRYGFVPNLFEAVIGEPRFLRCNMRALELLEAPQSATLSPRQHALVRALVSSLNRCAYSAVTTRAQLQKFPNGDALYDKVIGVWDSESWDDSDRLVLSFALKAARNAYKTVERDAQGFRDAGLGDEAYVDVLNTVAMQTSLDRLANSLGVRPDVSPMLALQPSVMNA
ncbi:MAG: putative peroxidase-related enzyme [Gammaproteobacteria bacterium]